MIGKCLFPVAGYGTRFLPATKSMPKEMLPIVNKPLTQTRAAGASCQLWMCCRCWVGLGDLSTTQEEREY